MIDVTTRWLGEFDIDGWRMDVVRYIDHDVWRDVRAAVRSVRPDAYLLAEVMGDAGRWLRGDEFDATMNYTFRELSIDYFATGVIGTPTFLEGVLELLAMYPPDVTEVNHNLLGSHDTPRFLTMAGGDTDSLMLATLFQLTFPGAPGLYYGDELPMEGGADPDNRRGFDWTRSAAPITGRWHPSAGSAAATRHCGRAGGSSATSPPTPSPFSDHNEATGCTSPSTAARHQPPSPSTPSRCCGRTARSSRRRFGHRRPASGAVLR